MKELEIFERQYDSGFRAKIMVRPHYLKKFMGIIIDFGGSDEQKKSGGAHFLEHKLFDKEDGDIAHRFDAINANSNAFTANNETFFYAKFVDHWPQVIPLLFELVGTTHFTPKNVASERKIIDQELAMYEDEPDWEVIHTLMQMMYPKTNLAEDLTGTHKSISEMTPRVLQEIYDNNYIAPNMAFVAAGGFSQNQVKKIFAEVGKLQKQFIRPGNGQERLVKKPAPASKAKEVILQGNSSSNQVGIGIRMPSFEQLGFSNSEGQILLEMMFATLIGSSTKWFELSQKMELLDYPLYTNVSYTRQGNYTLLTGTSRYPEKLLDHIKLQLRAKPNEAIYSLQKKKFLAKRVRELNSLDTLAIEGAEYLLENEDSRQILQKLQTLSFNEYCEYFRTIMDKSDIFTTILKRRENPTDI